MPLESELRLSVDIEKLRRLPPLDDSSMQCDRCDGAAWYRIFKPSTAERSLLLLQFCVYDMHERALALKKDGWMIAESRDAT